MICFTVYFLVVKFFYETIKYNPECQNCDYIYVFLNNDGLQYDIFDKTFHKKYNSIIKKSKQIIT